jgi:DNA-binding transcriptional LysR family regulator
VLHVGFIASAANEATQDIIAAFGRVRPEWGVRLRQAAWSDPTAGLADGGVDAALVRLPFPGQEAFRVDELLAEPRWVALPAGHRLAGRERIAFRELWDEPFVAAPAGTGAWRDFWLGADEREGRPPLVGATTDQPDEWLNAIASGFGVALAPASSARFYARPGVVYRPVTGLSPSRVGVARPRDAHPVVRDFARCCREAVGGGGSPVAYRPQVPPGAPSGPGVVVFAWCSRA